MEYGRQQMSGYKARNIYTNRYWVVILAQLSSVLWGSAFPVLKVSFATMHIAAGDLKAEMTLAGMRFFLAGLLLFAFIVITNRQVLKWQKGLGWKLCLLGILQISLQYFFFYNGLIHTSGMKGAVLSSSSTFFVVLLAHFFYQDDRLTWPKLFGLVTGLGGIILANWGKGFSMDFAWQGEGFMILAGLASAGGNLVAKRMAQNIEPLLLTGGQLVIGSLLLLAIGLPGLRPGAMVFNLNAWLLLLYAAFLSATAFFLWFSLLKYNKAGEISIYSFLTPVSGAILSVIFLPGETFSPVMLGALLLVALGLVAVNRANGEK